MKKGLIVFGFLCLIVGGIMCFVSYSNANFEYKSLIANNGYIEKTDTCDDVDVIRLDLKISDLTIKSSDCNEISIVYSEDKYRTYTITKIEELYIEENKQSLPWYMYSFNFLYFLDNYMIITVPNTFDGKIIIDSTVGSVKIENITCEQIDINTNTSSVKLETIETPNLKVKTTTGAIILENITTNIFDATCTTGYLKTSELKASTVNIKTETGGATLIDADITGDVNIKSTTGNIKLTNVKCANAILKATTGNIRVDELEVGNISAELTTGNITCTLIGNASDYTMFASTRTGNTNITNGGSGSKNITFKSTTGNIKLYWKI